MSVESRVVFVGKSELGIEDLYLDLLKICNFCEIEDYFDEKVIKVKPGNDYRLAAAYGNIFAVSKDYDVKWVDLDGRAKETNDFCICRISRSYLSDYPGDEVEEFTKNLSKVLNIPLSYKFDFNSSSKYEIHIKLSDIVLDAPIFMYNKKINLIFEKLKKFVDDYLRKNNYMYCAIEIVDLDMHILHTNYQEEYLKMLSLREYFLSSSLHLGLFHPEGKNISPKPDKKYFEDETGVHIGAYSYGIIDFTNGKLEKEENGVSSNNNYVFYCKEEYDREGEKKDRSFKFTDSMVADYNIEFLSDNKLIVTTKATCKRLVEGKKFGTTKRVYDELLKNSKYQDCEYSFEVIDIYEIIDVNLMIHYTDISKYYEVYEIPVGFKFEDGLKSVIKSRVYDDCSDDYICHNDISEVIKSLIANH